MQEIWVGELEGEALVYDPAIQLPGCPHVFLWNPVGCDMGKYVADVTRTRIKAYSSSEYISAHIASYVVWRDSVGPQWLADEKQYYGARLQGETAKENERLRVEAAREQERKAQDEAERVSRLTPTERHKELLERLGKEYQGVRKATRLNRHRVTHCYSCKSGLDNSIDVECVACAWILCNCGACGCGYSRSV